MDDGALPSTIITIGVFMGIIVVPLTNLCYVGVLLYRKKLRPVVPRWLIIANVLFFLVLLYYIFYINDQQHY
jgi:hypothetical protein